MYEYALYRHYHFITCFAGSSARFRNYKYYRRNARPLGRYRAFGARSAIGFPTDWPMSLHPGFPLLPFPTTSSAHTHAVALEKCERSLCVRLVDLNPEAGEALAERTGPLAPCQKDGARDTPDPESFFYVCSGEV